MNTDSVDDGRPVVFIVDDDAGLRDSVGSLLRSIGIECEAFGSAEEFLASGSLGQPGCLLLDVRLPGQSGLSLQARLLDEGSEMPVILMSGHGDVQMAVQAMKNGAIDFLTKPVRPQDLVDAVNLALATDAARREDRRSAQLLAFAYAALSDREREVMALIADGESNKAAAAALGISEATVKVHRARVMQKMGVRTLAHLVEAARQIRSRG